MPLARNVLQLPRPSAADTKTHSSRRVAVYPCAHNVSTRCLPSIVYDGEPQLLTVFLQPQLTPARCSPQASRLCSPEVNTFLLEWSGKAMLRVCVERCLRNAVQLCPWGAVLTQTGQNGRNTPCLTETMPCANIVGNYRESRR